MDMAGNYYAVCNWQKTQSPSLQEVDILDLSSGVPVRRWGKPDQWGLRIERVVKSICLWSLAFCFKPSNVLSQQQQATKPKFMTNTLVCALHQHLPHAYMLATFSDIKQTKSILCMNNPRGFNIMFSYCDMTCFEGESLLTTACALRI